MNRFIFQIGEKVISLTNRSSNISQPRIKGNVYTVLDVMYCIKCGIQCVNISGSHGEYCDSICECGSRQNSNGLWWTSSKLFIRPEHLEDLMIEKANEEDYESADELKEMLESIKV